MSNNKSNTKNYNNDYWFHLGLASIAAVVTLIINILAFGYRAFDKIEYLYILDMVYIVGNSAHLIALSLGKFKIEPSSDR